jgi:xanthine dehydrogenase small subunit
VRNIIEFVLNGDVKRLDSIDPTLTVLRYLREVERLTGTKEGCAEGDCGACTAVVADLEGGALRYRAVNTCIQLVGMLDGKALITVEHLKSNDGLHPVQQTMVDHHASQCGFCTPGFVMSLFAGYQEELNPERDVIDTLLAGNLCRCTGYSAIIKAAEKALGPRSGGNCFAARERQLVGRLRQIKRGDGLHVELDRRRYIAPKSIDELARLLRRYPKATLVAGATDVGLLVAKQHRRLDTLIDLGKVKELARISHGRNGLRLGAAVTYERAQRELGKLYPSLNELIRRFGSVQVRSLGTIGGNIANASPIGDMPPALIAASARLRLRRNSEIREIPLEDFFISYGRQDRRSSEFIESVYVPKPKAHGVLEVYKVSKRFDQDISSLCGAFHLTFDNAAEPKRVCAARICFGGMAGTPLRARQCEEFLVGKRWSGETVAEAARILENEYQPISDWRASADYRIAVAGNLLRRFFLETTTEGDLRLAGHREVVHAH